MTFDEYINNPMGKHNSVFSHRQMYQSMYMQKLDAILLREVGKIQYFLYTVNDTYILHMKVPSEVVEKFYYDVVVQFSSINPTVKMGNSLRKYDVKFYSNDPSFCYTFAHAFYKNNMFINLLKEKMPKEMVNKVAKERNPKDQVGYVKSIFFCYLLAERYNLFDKSLYRVFQTKFNKKTFMDSIEFAQDKIDKRQELAKKPKQQKIKTDNTPTPTRQHTQKNSIIGTREKESHIKNTGITSKTKTTKKAKTTKRI